MLKIYGTGSGRIEIARDALSRCYDQPLEMDEGGEYKKAIARAGDVHWYTVRAASDGDKLISVLPSEEGVRLSARLVSDSGEILAESDDLEMGACFLSAFFAAGTRYSIRVFAREGETGQIHAAHSERRGRAEGGFHRAFQRKGHDSRPRAHVGHSARLSERQQRARRVCERRSPDCRNSEGRRNRGQKPEPRA